MSPPITTSPAPLGGEFETHMEQLPGTAHRLVFFLQVLQLPPHHTPTPGSP